MMHTGFHQANYVAERVLVEVETIQQNVIKIPQKHENDSANSVPATEAPTTEAPTTTTSSNSTHMSSISHDEKALAVVDPQNLYLITIIKQLQDEIKTMKEENEQSLNKKRTTSKYC